MANVPIHLEQGGARLNVGAGGTLAVEGTLRIAATGALVQVGGPQLLTFTPAPGAANVCEVTIQVCDGDGAAIPFVYALVVYLSDSDFGEGLTTTTASGAVEVKPGEGADLLALVTKKSLLAQTHGDGAYVLSITDTAKTAFYVCAHLLGGMNAGGAWASRRLTSGDYGA